MDAIRALLFRVPGLLCALATEHVVETLRPLPIETIAGMPPFVLGVSIIRGAATPVVDAAKLLDGRHASRVGRFVLLRIDAAGDRPQRGPIDAVGDRPQRGPIDAVGARRVALAVEAVVGVRDLVADTLKALPPLLGGGTAHGVDALSALDRELCVVLAGGRFVPEDVWRRVSSAGVGAEVGR